MRDPQTLVYGCRFFDIWHVDPERDGTDDSCGWARAKLTDADYKVAKDMADWEQRFPYYFAQVQRVVNPRYPNLWRISPGDAAMLVLELWHQIAWRLERRRLTPRDAMEAMRLGHSEADNFQTSFTATDQREQERVLCYVIRAYRTYRRPWWRHPRWHVHHWKINVHAVLHIKRWLFTRCATCGGRFRYGESPVTASWHSDGPRWFRGEQNMSHMQCFHARSDGGA